MPYVEANVEGILADVELAVDRHAGDRVPVLVAHGGVDAAHELDLAQLDVAKVDTVEYRRQRPRSQRHQLRRRPVDAVQDERVGRVHRRS